jgi:hypothetical protein
MQTNGSKFVIVQILGIYCDEELHDNFGIRVALGTPTDPTIEIAKHNIINYLIKALLHILRYLKIFKLSGVPCAEPFWIPGLCISTITAPSKGFLNHVSMTLMISMLEAI